MLTKAPAFKRQKNSRTEQHRIEIQKGNTFKNTKKLRRLELGRKKICLRKQQSHTEKNNNMKNLNITNVQLGMIYIYHIYRQRERELCTKQIATKHSFQTPYNSCNNKPDVRLPKKCLQKVPKQKLHSPSSD